MPLVVLCGFPSSGKTKRTNEIKKQLETNDKKVIVVSEHNFGIDKNLVYADSKKEVSLRGDLRSGVLREISKETVVILDSLNYIKGFRYELFCGIKSAQTPHCVVHCDVSDDDAREWNEGRPEGERYNQDVFDALVMRFEPPVGKNRWDKPLFSLKKDENVDFDAISSALFNTKPPARNMSTVSQPLSSTNFLYELDKKTQQIVTSIDNPLQFGVHWFMNTNMHGLPHYEYVQTVIAAQKTSVPGEAVMVPGATDKLFLIKHLSMAELQRHRRQFISYSKLHPVENVGMIPNMFIQYLSNSIK